MNVFTRKIGAATTTCTVAARRITVTFTCKARSPTTTTTTVTMDFEFTMVRRRLYVEVACEADTDTTGDCFGPEQEKHQPPQSVVRYAPTTASVETARDGKSSPEESINHGRFLQNINLNDMLMMKEYPIKQSLIDNGVSVKGVNNSANPTSAFNISSLTKDQKDFVDSSSQVPPAQNETTGNRIKGDVQTGESRLISPMSLPKISTTSSINDKPSCHEKSMIDARQRRHEQCKDMISEVSFVADHKLGKAGKQFMRNNVGSSGKRFLQRSNSCIVTTSTKEYKDVRTVTDKCIENAPKLGSPTTGSTVDIRNANGLNDDKPTLWTDRTTISNTVNKKATGRGLQRSKSLRMIPNSSMSSHTGSNQSHRENLSRQMSVRMVPSASFSSRGSSSSTDITRKREKLARRVSSTHLVPNVSFSSGESNTSREISNKRDKLYRKSSAHLIQNGSFASRHSQRSFDSFTKREKPSPANSDINPHTPMASDISKQPLTKQIESRGSSFIDKVIEISNELFHAQNTNEPVASYDNVEKKQSCQSKEKRRGSTQSRRSNISLEAYFTKVSQNEKEPKQEVNETLDLEHNYLDHRQEKKDGNGFDHAHDLQLLTSTVRNHNNQQEQYRRRRGSTGTINMHKY